MFGGTSFSGMSGAAGKNGTWLTTIKLFKKYYYTLPIGSDQNLLLMYNLVGDHVLKELLGTTVDGLHKKDAEQLDREGSDHGDLLQLGQGLWK